MSPENPSTDNPDMTPEGYVLAQRRALCDAVGDLIERTRQRVVIFALWMGDPRSRAIIAAYQRELPEAHPCHEDKHPWQFIYTPLRVAVRLAPDLAPLMDQAVETDEVLAVRISERGLEVAVCSLGGPDPLAAVRPIHWAANEEATAKPAPEESSIRQVWELLSGCFERIMAHGYSFKELSANVAAGTATHATLACLLQRLRVEVEELLDAGKTAQNVAALLEDPTQQVGPPEELRELLRMHALACREFAEYASALALVLEGVFGGELGRDALAGVARLEVRTRERLSQLAKTVATLISELPKE